MTIPDTSSHIDENEESWNLEDFDQDSFLSHKLELDQFQTLDKLASFSFNEIELECDPNLQPCDLIFIFESMLIPVSLPNLDHFLELTFIPILVDVEIDHQI